MVGPLIHQAFRFPILLLTRVLSDIWPTSEHHVAMGAWFGTLCSDNPKYFLMSTLKNAEIKIHWIGIADIENTIPQAPNIDFAKKGTLKAFFAILRSRWVICTHSPIFDLCSHPIFRKRNCLNLGHGIPIRYIGQGLRKTTQENSSKKSLLATTAKHLYSWLVKKSKLIVTPVASEKMADLFAIQNSDNYFGMFLPLGTPRNDFLIKHKEDISLKCALRKKYSTILGFDANAKIVLYAPTWRASGKNVFAFYNQDQRISERLRRVLSNHSAVLIEKHHWMTYVQYPASCKSETTIVMTKEQQISVDVQELLLITDVLICDYSSIYTDYGLLERPCIHFAYDLDEYMCNDAGLAYDIEQVAAGPIVRTVDGLLGKLSELLANPVFEPAPHYHELVKYETGHSCEQLARFMKLKMRT